MKNKNHVTLEAVTHGYINNRKGITLISLIITIIVMLILAGIVLLFSVGEDGIIERVNESKRKTEFAEFKEKVGLEYLGLKNGQKDKETIDLFRELDEKMQLEDYFIGNESFIIKYDEETYITLLKDGTIIDGKKIELNIADGSIELRKNGYIQGKTTVVPNSWNTHYKIDGKLVEYTGDYTITGTSIENMVRVSEEGTYNITIKDLNIDVSNIENVCAFNANRNRIGTGVFVNLYIEGNNSLYSGKHAAGIGFANAVANIDGVVNGSTLTIQGEGMLYAQGGGFGAGIGTGYGGSETAGGDANNIIINSGYIIAKGNSSAAAIGGARYRNVNNLIINGGNIEAVSTYGGVIGTFGRGADENTGILKNLIINDGNIKVIAGQHGAGIGGEKGSKDLIINGGNIYLEKNVGNQATLGNGIEGIEVNGGKIFVYSKNSLGIGSNTTLPFELEKNGGEISVDDKTCCTPVNLSNGNWYLTKFKIGELAKQLKVESVQTNNNIEYEIENLYTMENGHLYMFLPEGEVTVSVTVAGTTYTGTVTVTPENAEVFNLN